MSAHLTFRRIADDVIEIPVSTASEAQALAASLRETGIAEDVVAGLNSVALRFDPADLSAIESRLGPAVSSLPTVQLEREPIEIEMTYGGEHGPDFEHVCAQLGVSQSAFIERHTALLHTVDMIGFTPGFSYISGLPETWRIPRLSNPRSRVGAGSVGITAGYTGIYALAGPGGWPLIGRTSAPLFDPDAAEPFLLAPGQRVKFKAA